MPPTEDRRHLDDDDFAVIHEEVGACIRVNVVKPLRLEDVVELGVPHLGSLLQPIQRLEETTNLVRVRRIYIAVWLLHVDLLVKVAVEE